MANKNLFRLAGWCALVAVLLLVAVFVTLSVAPTSPAGMILAIVGVLVLTPVFYALYVTHRAESAGLSLAGFVLWIPAAAVDLYSLANPANTFLYNLDCILFSLPFLIFGFLAYRSARMPNGLAVMGLLSGIFYLLTGVAGFIGSATLGMVASLGSFVFMVIWLVWLWRIFVSGKLATA